MQKQTVSFAVESKNGVVTNIGKSYIEVPEIKFKGGSVKWFDDSQLIRKAKTKQNKIIYSFCSKNIQKGGQKHIVFEYISNPKYYLMYQKYYQFF